MPISSSASVSMAPPMILQCVARPARCLPALTIGARVVVNVLANDQGALAQRFASRSEDRFAGVQYGTDIHGSPVLADTAAWIGGTVAHPYDAGDHVIVLITAHT